MLRLACDPGLRGCGLGLYEGSTLRAAWYSRNTEKTARGPTAWWAMARAVYLDTLRFLPRDVHAVDRFVLEVPQVYRGPRMKGDPADLLELTGVGGAIASTIPHRLARGLLPREWKGQVPKEIHQVRVLAKLSPEEHTRIQPVAASLRHNVVDGVGLGLFDLGR